MQNTRYEKGESKNDAELSAYWASLADAFVMDAFGSAHRAHCSTAGVTNHIKDTAVGYLMQKEIEYLGNAVETPVRPFVAILGGAKDADKLNVQSQNALLLVLDEPPEKTVFVLFAESNFIH